MQVVHRCPDVAGGRAFALAFADGGIERLVGQSLVQYQAVASVGAFDVVVLLVHMHKQYFHILILF